MAPVSNFRRRGEGEGAPAPADAQAALRAALKHANRVIVAAGADTTEGPSERSMGSTAVVLVIAPDTARACWAHVGDSRLQFRSDVILSAGVLLLLCSGCVARHVTLSEKGMTCAEAQRVAIETSSEIREAYLVKREA